MSVRNQDDDDSHHVALQMIQDLVTKSGSSFLDFFAQLGIFKKVHKLCGSASDDEDEKVLYSNCSFVGLLVAQNAQLRFCLPNVQFCKKYSRYTGYKQMLQISASINIKYQIFIKINMKIRHVSICVTQISMIQVGLFVIPSSGTSTQFFSISYGIIIKYPIWIKSQN